MDLLAKAVIPREAGEGVGTHPFGRETTSMLVFDFNPPHMCYWPRGRPRCVNPGQGIKNAPMCAVLISGG